MNNSEVIANVLEHHGTKGMKWGVHREKAAGGDKRSIKKLQKADAKWQKNIYTMNGAIAVHNAVAHRMNSQIEEINNNPKWKDIDLNEHPKIAKQYNAEMERRMEKAYAEAVIEVHGVSPSGKKQAAYVSDDGTGEAAIVIKDVNVKHNDTEQEPDLTIQLNLDNNGLVTSCREINTSVDHGSDAAGQILEHHGIKGMKWGQRKTRSVGVSRSKGHEVPASEDAKKANSFHDKAHKHGAAALSNQELQHLVNRMNLEQQYSRLQSTSGAHSGASFAKKMLVDVGKQQLTRLANEQAAKQVALLMAKTAAGR